jgi:cell division protein FtsZ
MSVPRKHHPAPKPTITKPATAPDSAPDKADAPATPKPRFRLVGVGGAGCNTINHIGSLRVAGKPQGLAGVELLAVNTDIQALQSVTTAERLQIGADMTHGLGAGGDPEVGARAAQGDAERLQAALHGADVVILGAGMGGGTGSGASPVLARLAKEQGALVVAFAALPFSFEGDRRLQQALVGIEQLKQHADAVICIPNDKLFKILGENASVVDAFRRSDEMVARGAQAIWQLVSRKGLINLDFADIRATLAMPGAGPTAKRSDGLFSFGEAEGQNRARDAVKHLLENPVFEGGDALVRAEGVLVSILGGPDLTLADVQRAVEPITRLARRARVVMGAAIDEESRGRVAIAVIAATNALPRKFPQTIAGGRAIPIVRAVPVNVTRIPTSAPVASAPTKPTVEPVAVAPAPVPATPPSAKKAKPRQETLPLERVTRGRFDKSEPTLYDGEDLDVPTFIRRGVSLKR